MTKIGWLNNRRYNLPADLSFLLNDLDAKDEEIARLLNTLADARTESMKLRAALEDIAKVTYGWEPGVWSDEEARKYFASLFFGAQSKARAALEGK